MRRGAVSILAGWLACASACGAVTTPATVRADTPVTPTHVYRMRARVEVPVLAIALVTAGGAHAMGAYEGPRCPCDPARLDALDRSFAGRDSHPFEWASHAAAAAMILGPYALDAFDLRGRHDANAAWGHDATVFAEALALDIGVNDLVRRFVHRPRPWLYGRDAKDPEMAKSDNYRSFYSVHTSSAFAAGMCYARTYAYRHPQRSGRSLAYAAAVLGGSTVGACRVGAGAHFPTDTMIAALAGTAIGLLVPALHR